MMPSLQRVSCPCGRRAARYARHAVIITSTVSNEAVLRGLPVVSCGRAWHSGLGVFAEAKDWPDLAVTPQVDAVARGRWINWWIRRSCSPERTAERSWCDLER